MGRWDQCADATEPAVQVVEQGKPRGCHHKNGKRFHRNQGDVWWKRGKSRADQCHFYTKKGFHSYLYGDETMYCIENGKGNLKLNGQNIISAMHLKGQPYFFK